MFLKVDVFKSKCNEVTQKEQSCSIIKTCETHNYCNVARVHCVGTR